MSPDTKISEVRSTIDELLRGHAQALIGKDVDKALNLYSMEPVIRPNHADPVSGREALRSMFATWFQNVTILRLEYKTEELWVHGDMAVQIGTAEGTVQPVGGPPMVDRNNFMGIWIRDAEGHWRAHRNVFNSSLPLPAPSDIQ